MDKASDKTYSSHILKSKKKIQYFIERKTFEQFENDNKTKRAVTRDLEIIGEAAKRLSEEFKDKHGEIPWRRVAGMRDFLIHDYTEVDLKEVWKAATEDIEDLKKALE